MKKQKKFLIVGGIAILVLLIVIFGSQFGFFATIIGTSTNYECNSPASEFSYSCSPQSTGYNIPTQDPNVPVISGRQISVEGFRPFMTFRLDPSVWINVMKRDVPETATFFNSYVLCSKANLGLYFSGSSSQSIIYSVSYINKGYENYFGLFHYNSCDVTGCPSTDCYRFWRANDVVSYRMNNNQLAIFKGKVTCEGSTGESATLYAVGKYNTQVRYVDFEDDTIYITGNTTKFSCPTNTGEVKISAEALTLPLKVGGYTDEQFKNVCVDGSKCVGTKLFVCENYQFIDTGDSISCGFSQFVEPVNDVLVEITQNVTSESTDQEIIDTTIEVIENSDLTEEQQTQVIDQISETYDIPIDDIKSSPNYLLWALIGLIGIVVLIVVILLIRRR